VALGLLFAVPTTETQDQIHDSHISPAVSTIIVPQRSIVAHPAESAEENYGNELSGSRPLAT